MANLTGLKTPWTQVAKEYKESADSISSWERVLTGLQQSAQIQQETAARQADYDISQAYANYLRQQQATKASTVDESFKNRLSQQLSSAYNQAFTKAKTTQAQTLANVAEQYQKDAQTAEKSFEEVGTALAKQHEYLNEYLAQVGETGLSKIYKDVDWSNIGDYRNSGLYEFKDGSYQLTTKGKEIYKAALLNDITYTGGNNQAVSTSYGRWLQETHPEAYENYVNYAEQLRSGFDIEPGTITYDTKAGSETARKIRLDEYREKATEYSKYYKVLNLRDVNEETLRKNIADILNISSGMGSVDIDTLRYDDGKKRFVATINGKHLNTQQQAALEAAGFYRDPLNGRYKYTIKSSEDLSNIFEKLKNVDVFNKKQVLEGSSGGFRW